MDFTSSEFSSYVRQDRSTLHTPDFEGLPYEVERFTWPKIGRAFRSVVNKIR